MLSRKIISSIILIVLLVSNSFANIFTSGYIEIGTSSQLNNYKNKEEIHYIIDEDTYRGFLYFYDTATDSEVKVETISIEDLGIERINKINRLRDEIFDMGKLSDPLKNTSDAELIKFGIEHGIREDLLKFQERRVFVPMEKYKHLDVQENAFVLCEGSNLDYLLIIAIMMTESSMREEATHVNIDGPAPGSVDRGLFQINSYYEPGYVKDFLAGYDIFYGLDNMIIALKRLKENYKKFHDFYFITDAHNKGTSGADSGDYTSTDYVERVKKYYNELYNNYVVNYEQYYVKENLMYGRDEYSD